MYEDAQAGDHLSVGQFVVSRMDQFCRRCRQSEISATINFLLLVILSCGPISPSSVLPGPALKDTRRPRDWPERSGDHKVFLKKG